MALCKSVYYYYYYYHHHKAAGRKTRLDIQNYGCDGNLLCYHGVVERNRISSLQSHEKALEKECCLPGAFRDSGDTPIIIIIIIYTPGSIDPGVKNKKLKQISLEVRGSDLRQWNRRNP